MRKSKYGFSMHIYAVLGFIFAMVRLPILCLALLLFVHFVEKDEWISRQILCSLIISLIIFIFNPVLMEIAEIIPLFSSIISVVVRVASAIVYGISAVLSVLGILRVMKDNEANLPLISPLADLIYSVFKSK